VSLEANFPLLRKIIPIISLEYYNVTSTAYAESDFDITLNLKRGAELAGATLEHTEDLWGWITFNHTFGQGTQAQNGTIKRTVMFPGLDTVEGRQTYWAEAIAADTDLNGQVYKISLGILLA
jgi:hypothetical protein